MTPRSGHSDAKEDTLLVSYWKRIWLHDSEQTLGDRNAPPKVGLTLLTCAISDASISSKKGAALWRGMRMLTCRIDER